MSDSLQATTMLRCYKNDNGPEVEDQETSFEAQLSKLLINENQKYQNEADSLEERQWKNITTLLKDCGALQEEINKLKEDLETEELLEKDTIKKNLAKKSKIDQELKIRDTYTKIRTDKLALWEKYYP